MDIVKNLDKQKADINKVCSERGHRTRPHVHHAVYSYGTGAARRAVRAEGYQHGHRDTEAQLCCGG